MDLVKIRVMWNDGYSEMFDVTEWGLGPYFLTCILTSGLVRRIPTLQVRCFDMWKIVAKEEKVTKEGEMS